MSVPPSSTPAIPIQFKDFSSMSTQTLIVEDAHSLDRTLLEIHKHHERQRALYKYHNTRCTFSSLYEVLIRLIGEFLQAPHIIYYYRLNKSLYSLVTKAPTYIDELDVIRLHPDNLVAASQLSNVKFYYRTLGDHYFVDIEEFSILIHLINCLKFAVFHCYKLFSFMGFHLQSTKFQSLVNHLSAIL
jgi:hypothetical protein